MKITPTHQELARLTLPLIQTPTFERRDARACTLLHSADMAAMFVGSTVLRLILFIATHKAHLGQTRQILISQN